MAKIFNQCKGLMCCMLILSLVFIGAACAKDGAGQQNSAASQQQGEGVASPGITTPQPENTPGQITPADEIINAELYSGLVQFGSLVLGPPATYADIKAAGAVLADTEYSEDYLIDANSTVYADMAIGGAQFTVCFKNTSEQRSALKEAEVEMFYCTTGGGIFFPKGLSVGDSLSTLTEKWGEPSEDISQSYDKQLTYIYMEYPVLASRVEGSMYLGAGREYMSVTGFEYTVTIDRNSTQITKIECDWVDKAPDGPGVEMVDDIIYWQDTYELSYTIPVNFYANLISTTGRAVSVIMVEGVPYVVVLNTRMLGAAHQESITEESLVLCINVNEYSPQYAVKVLSNNGVTATAVGYLEADGAVQCRPVYMNAEHEYIPYEDSKIMPLDENGTITAAAKEAFEAIMEEFVASISEKAASG